jgi:hypothetical protein
MRVCIISLLFVMIGCAEGTKSPLTLGEIQQAIEGMGGPQDSPANSDSMEDEIAPEDIVLPATNLQEEMQRVTDAIQQDLFTAPVEDYSVSEQTDNGEESQTQNVGDPNQVVESILDAVPEDLESVNETLEDLVQHNQESVVLNIEDEEVVVDEITYQSNDTQSISLNNNSEIIDDEEDNFVEKVDDPDIMDEVIVNNIVEEPEVDCKDITATMNTSSGSWFTQKGNLAGQKLSKEKRQEIRTSIKTDLDLIKTITKELRRDFDIKKVDEIDQLRNGIVDMRGQLQAGRKAKGIFAYSANQILDLDIVNNCKAGWYRVKVIARNNGTLPSWYENFKLEVLYGVTAKTYINIPASDKGYFSGKSAPVFIPNGAKTIEIIWKNDAWSKNNYDANINIKDVRLVKVKERKKKKLLVKNALEICDSRGKWYSSRRDMYTFWGKQELYYCFSDLPAGEYKVSILGKNTSDSSGYTIPSFYENFEIAVGNSKTQQQVTVFVPASDYVFKRGKSATKIMHNGGDLKLYVYWKNDYYDKKEKHDANFRMRNIRLHK